MQRTTTRSRGKSIISVADDGDYATVDELRVPAESAATVDRRIQH
ncbi:MAG: hypothetical protein R6V29_00590 [Spirochaetia bacterium]